MGLEIWCGVRDVVWGQRCDVGLEMCCGVRDVV